MKKVIFVDDSKAILFTIEEAVEQFVENGQIEATFFDNPEKAIEDIKSGNVPDLIFTDINMPEMTGYEMIKVLRGEGVTCPVIALTTEKTKEQKEKGKEVGMNAWLVKPFTEDKIQGMISKVFGI